MTAEILHFDGVTSLDISADRVLEAAKAAEMQAVIIIGYDADGGEYFASSISDGPEVLWALERAKMRLMRIVDGGEE